MNLRTARKICLLGRPDDRDRPGLPSRYVLRARRIVIRHWARNAYRSGMFRHADEPAADHRALEAMRLRVSP